MWEYKNGRYGGPEGAAHKAALEWSPKDWYNSVPRNDTLYLKTYIICV